MRPLGGTQKARYRIAGALALAVIVAMTCVATAANAAAPQPTQRDWQNQIAQTPQPSKGCFTATYPRLAWHPTACTSAPDYPQEPGNGPRPLVVGNGHDVSALVPTGFISTAIGSFDVANVSSEAGPIGNAGPSINNAYTLQLNTNYFATTACAASPNPACQGWEQFVYANNGSSGALFIQYWLLNYNAACPATWNTFTFAGGTTIYCYRNDSGGAVAVPNQPITNLINLSLSGQAAATSDGATLFVGTTAYSRAGDNSVKASAGWNQAEFNVFGDGGNNAGGGTATFNTGASLTVRTRTVYGGTAAPLCRGVGFTGEKNSLSFGTPAPAPTPPGPAVEFVEDTVGGASSICASASTIGDVHALTVAGLAYDFQATGDFEVAQVGANFEVQARQVSGAPNWPNAAVNQAVATRMGNDTVAVCAGPRLVVDGQTVQLAGGVMALPSGVDITLSGGVYTVTDPTGNSIQVTPHPTYLNLSVGVGTWPTTVRGLIGNPNNNVGQLQASDGTIYAVPLSFNDLYQHYGNSWRITANSLLAPCGNPSEQGNPTKTFFASDLDPTVRAQAQSVCHQYGVSSAWLDDCTLDVAVLGSSAAAAYVGLAPPVVNGNE